MRQTARCFTRVVKLGGSLLSWPPLSAALPSWLADQPPGANILIAGGGELADVVRRADAAYALGEENCHRLCVELMGVSAQLVHCLLPHVAMCQTMEELRNDIATGQAPVVVFDPRNFLARHEAHCPGIPLPHTWQVTSDSIAARIAETIDANELVLLKSADLPNHQCLRDLAAGGYVDAFFPVAAEPIIGRTRFVNLRRYHHD